MKESSSSEQPPEDVDPGSTGYAPTFRQAFVPQLPAPSLTPAQLREGDRVDDFELLHELGKGSFGRVYLARQLSLDRLVALKVSTGPDNEARTLARLEHGHIVQVFSETTDPHYRVRLLCMQYVPGQTLEGVIEALAQREPRRRHGRAILEVLDNTKTPPVPLEPAALREREVLAGCDWIEAGCRLGSRLAEALAHAHRSGILHRDVKPANVLINLYGRPFLADFNVSANTQLSQSTRLGGTLSYMAPEHLEAFAGVKQQVDERADIYSLGMVLYEWFTGRLPPVTTPPIADIELVARAVAQQRRAGPPPIPDDVPLPPPVERVLRRCLEPDPTRRYASATELARALDSCRDLRRVEKTLPVAGPITLALQKWPFVLGCLLVLLPHFLGSIVNIWYNSLQIVGRLTPAQQDAFHRLVFHYNAIVYPICILILLLLVLPLRRVRLGLTCPTPPSSSEMTTARRRLLQLPTWIVAFSCLGWLTGGFLFQWLLDHSSGPIRQEVYQHFCTSFTVAGLIALTYSFFAVQFVVLRVLYPLLWTDTIDPVAVARMELRGLGARLTWFQVLAVLIPLAGAVLLVGIGEEGLVATSDRSFRLLVTALIGLGMFGFGVALTVSRRLNDTLSALTGGRLSQ